jgi:hypothetical protein
MKTSHNNRPYYDTKSNVGPKGQKVANPCSNILSLKNQVVYIKVTRSLQYPWHNLNDHEHALTFIMTM